MKTRDDVLLEQAYNSIHESHRPKRDAKMQQAQSIMDLHARGKISSAQAAEMFEDLLERPTANKPSPYVTDLEAELEKGHDKIFSKKDAAKFITYDKDAELGKGHDKKYSKKYVTDLEAELAKGHNKRYSKKDASKFITYDKDAELGKGHNKRYSKKAAAKFITYDADAV